MTSRSKLHELTNIGHELLALGRITMANLSQAQVEYAQRREKEPDLRFGSVLRDLGFATEEDLALAECSQQKSRDTLPENHSDSRDALKNLLKLVHVHERTSSTASGMRASDVDAAVEAALKAK